jgi:hypothetical protein
MSILEQRVSEALTCVDALRESKLRMLATVAGCLPYPCSPDRHRRKNWATC